MAAHAIVLRRHDGNNDLAGVGCCQAHVGYDLASGLGMPNLAVLPATLPHPAEPHDEA